LIVTGSPERENKPHATEYRRWRLASIEGYLSLVCIVTMFFLGGLLTSRLPEVFAVSINITVWAFAWLFAISGIRRGEGGARVVAHLMLTILFLTSMVYFLFTFH
jgi:hypothetical protein